MNIKIGIPNRGRLAEVCVQLINMTWNTNLDLHERKMNYFIKKDNMHINVCLIRSTDIPKMLEIGEIDLGITGSDYYLEAESDVVESNNLFLLNGLLCVISSKNNANDISNFKSCYSQYNAIANKFYESTTVNVRAIDGAAETYLELNSCDCSIDIVTTGETAIMNKVKVDFVIMPISAHIYINNTFFENRNEICKTIVENLSGQPLTGYSFSESVSYKRFCDAKRNMKKILGL